MFPIRMLALDVDGTLAANDRHEVSPATRKALHELSAENVDVVIVTGRRYRSTRWVIENLGLDVHSITHGGALLKCPEQKTLHQFSIDASQIHNISSIANDMDLCVFGLRDSHQDEGADIFMEERAPKNDHTRNYLEANNQYVQQLKLSEVNEPLLNIGCFDIPEKLNQFAEEVHRQYSDQISVLVLPPGPNSNTYYAEVTASNTDKWEALKVLGGILGTDENEICAVGDHLNDLPMIKKAAHGFAMGNAEPALKQVADHICGDHDKDGLIPVVEYIREHNIALV